MTSNIKYNYSRLAIFMALIIGTAISCSRELNELEPASYPTTSEVFIDGFSAGLFYVAFGNSKPTAFVVDQDVKYAGSASMKFAVPDFEDPEGAFAGGAFATEVGRDLTGYDALTFWVRATKAATIDVIGFGNDLGEAKHQTTILDLPVNTNWRKVILPLPDPSKLTVEKGMLFYSEAPEEGKGYTFWIDEVKFEKLGTIAHPKAYILEGQDQTVSAETGNKLNIGGLFATFNLPSGVDQRVELANGYYNFSSSDMSVATVNGNGEVTVLDAGTSVIKATFGDEDAIGSMTVESSGEPLLPPEPAPTPTVSPDSVISMFSNAYNDVLVDTWNPFWEFSTTQLADVKIGDDDVKKYNMLNFVGILTEAEKINASEMTHFHMDIWTPDPTDAKAFRILLRDYGADGNFDGGDDSFHEVTISSPPLATETWVSLDIPLLDFAGLVNKGNIAQLVLSGDIPNVFVDNVYYYNAGEVKIDGPEAPAPTPTAAAEDVISIYSNAYDDVPVDTYSAEWGQAAVSDEQIDGNDVKLYRGLNFTGIEFTSQTVNISSMERFHMDIWTPDPSAPPAAFRVKLVDFGPDNAFQGGDDTDHEIVIDANTNPALATESWVSIDLPLSDFAGLTGKGNLAQIVISGDPNTVFVDNIYFYKGGGGSGGATEPTIAAPTPTQNEADVISLFSDAYNDVPVDTWRTDWSNAVFEDVTVDGNATKKYSALEFAGIETVANTLDVSGMTHLHIDVWSPDFELFAINLVDFGADNAFGGGDDVNHQVEYQTPAQGQWISYDIPLSDFTGLVTKQNLAQYILVGRPLAATTVFVDNIYFYNADGGGSATEPTIAAPAPTQNEADVISLFSDAYTDVPVDTWKTDWSNATFEDVTVDGNATKKYSALEFAGIETVANTLDVSGMTHLHIDVWSSDFELFAINLVDFGADGAFGGGDDVNHQVEYQTPAQGQWISYDIPLSDFTGLVTKQNLAQYILVGRPLAATTIFVDNIYFYNADGGGGGGSTEPSIAAPAPTRDEANVISLFSDAYTDVPVDTWKTDWSNATFEDVTVDGNATKKYSALEFAGIETVANTLDISDMTHIHIDVWSPDFELFAINLVDFGADGAFGGGDDVNHQVEFQTPAQGQWISYDIPLSDFTGLVTKQNMAQYILVGRPLAATTIWVDNIYFYKE